MTTGLMSPISLLPLSAPSMQTALATKCVVLGPVWCLFSEMVRTTSFLIRNLFIYFLLCSFFSTDIPQHVQPPQITEENTPRSFELNWNIGGENRETFKEPVLYVLQVRTYFGPEFDPMNANPWKTLTMVSQFEHFLMKLGIWIVVYYMITQSHAIVSVKDYDVFF